MGTTLLPMVTELTLVPQQRGPLQVAQVASFAELGFDLVVTDRFGGVSSAPYDELNLALHVGDDAAHVAVNRELLAQALGTGTEALQFANQVHGAAVDEVTRSHEPVAADALTTTTSLALAIMAADCLPIAMASPREGRGTVAHAGWRGLAAGVVTRALETFQHPDDVSVFFGPCISLDAYQVGADVAAHFADVPRALTPDGPGHFRLDLREVALRQLVAAGVDESRLTVVTNVTDGGETYFSDRAQRPCGRHAVVLRRIS
jgi:YfiH family protein